MARSAGARPAPAWDRAASNTVESRPPLNATQYPDGAAPDSCRLRSSEARRRSGAKFTAGSHGAVDALRAQALVALGKQLLFRQLLDLAQVAQDGRLEILSHHLRIA